MTEVNEFLILAMLATILHTTFFKKKGFMKYKKFRQQATIFELMPYKQVHFNEILQYQNNLLRSLYNMIQINGNKSEAISFPNIL